ncbi:hypothetical protein DXX93_16335 [Thalassotalea euphylliae]|uniref:Uncharacterized protein n=1 Tax=Thalassotalea euphylliae TaxID=1655234 RepID=A0A3E0TU65_9GAMM|nr:hypothetical protein DXX93_16335 [Thalassotalea euphylliae]
MQGITSFLTSSTKQLNTYPAQLKRSNLETTLSTWHTVNIFYANIFVIVINDKKFLISYYSLSESLTIQATH